MKRERLGTKERLVPVLRRVETTPKPGPSGKHGEWLTNQAAMETMLPVIGWKIWYTDRSTWCSDTSKWDGAPSGGVQQVAYFHPGGLKTLSGGIDEYFYPGSTHTKLGELTTDERAEEMRLAALNDTWSP